MDIKYYNKIKNNKEQMDIIKNLGDMGIQDLLMAIYVDNGIDCFYEFLNSIDYEIKFTGKI